MNKPLMILVLMVCLVSSVWAEKESDADIQAYPGESFGNRAIWANHMLWEGNATLREIDIGTKIKGVTDDTIRLFTVQSASPRQALLFTDTSSSSTTPMENRWRLDTLYTAADGYYSAEIGDVDRDGDNDLIFGRSSSPYKLMWWYWTGTGWNTDDTVICEITGTGYMYDIAIGDANNDGYDDDIVFTCYRSVLRAWWNGSSWDTLRLWAGDGSTCYGVAIGDFDATYAGNEIVTVTYNGSVMGIRWNSGTSTWDTATIYTPPAAWRLYDVEVGDFDSNHAGDEIVLANGGTIASTEGSIIEIYGSSGSGWSHRALYTPTGSQYVRELAIGDCLDENPGNEIVFVGSTSPYEATVVYGSGASWDNQAIFTPGGTSYGVEVGDVDQYRVDNDEIAVTGSYDVYEAEQFWPTNDLAITTGAPYSYPFVISDPESLWARVMNNGTATQNNFQVYLYINGVVYDSVTVASLTGGDSVDVDFGFVPAAQGEINFTIFHSLAPDEIDYNDTLGTIDPVAGYPNRFHDWVYEAGTYKAEGFEYLSSFPPPGWVVIDNDGGSYTWVPYLYTSNATYVHTGVWFTNCRYESASLRNDDWLITDVVNPTAGIEDSIGFYRRARSTTYAESLEVWAMSGQNVTDTIPGGIIWAGAFNETSYAPIKASLDAYDGQSIYIGFRNHALDAYYIHLDDIYWAANMDAIGPDIALVETPENTYASGPYTVRAVITDPSGVAADSLYYIVDDVATAIPNTGVVGDTFTYEIPTQSAGTCIDYYVMAADPIPNVSYSGQEHFYVLSPMAPTDLTATGQPDSTVYLAWLPPGEELSYHEAVTYYWDGWAVDDMIATQFTPQHTPCKLEALSLMFYNVTDTIEVRIWDDDGLGNPDSVLWADTLIVTQLYPNPEIIDVSAADILVSGDFHVGLVWLGADSPYPLSDGGATTTRSKANYGSGWQAIGYDWIMSTVVSYVAPVPDAVVRRATKSDKICVNKNHDKMLALQPNVMLPRRVAKHGISRAIPMESRLLETILGISNFEVSRSEASGGPYTSLGTTNQSPYVDNTVVSETQYYYVVQANYVSPDTVSYYSNEATIAVDFTPPSYANTTYDSLVGGPWVVSTEITEWTGLAYDSLAYRADGGTFYYVTNDSISGITYYYTIPSYPSYTLIEFYLFSQDSSLWQNAGMDPASGYYSFTVTSIAEYKPQELIPDHVFLAQNRPNPFARHTQIEYGVPQSMAVEIAIYNAAGQRISTLVDEVKSPGFYKANWQGIDDFGRRLAEGVYFVRMTTEELTDTKKLILIK